MPTMWTSTSMPRYKKKFQCCYDPLQQDLPREYSASFATSEPSRGGTSEDKRSKLYFTALLMFSPSSSSLLFFCFIISVFDQPLLFTPTVAVSTACSRNITRHLHGIDTKISASNLHHTSTLHTQSAEGGGGAAIEPDLRDGTADRNWIK